MMWIIPPVALVDREIAGNKRNRQTYDARNLETDVAPHSESRSGTVDEKPSAYYSGGRKHKERERCEQRMKED